MRSGLIKKNGSKNTLLKKFFFGKETLLKKLITKGNEKKEENDKGIMEGKSADITWQKVITFEGCL